MHRGDRTFEVGQVDDPFALAGQPVADQIRMITELAGTEHPHLLDAIAAAPLPRKVAKAARDAGERLRTGAMA